MIHAVAVRVAVRIFCLLPLHARRALVVREVRQKTSPEHLEAPARVPQVDDLLDFIFSVAREALLVHG